HLGEELHAQNPLGPSAVLLDVLRRLDRRAELGQGDERVALDTTLARALGFATPPQTPALAKALARIAAAASAEDRDPPLLAFLRGARKEWNAAVPELATALGESA